MLTAQEVYEEISSCNKENLQNAVNNILEKDYKCFKSKNRTLIVDASGADSDINFRSKKVTKNSIKDKYYKWARKQH